MTINTKALAAGITAAGLTLQQAIVITEGVINLIGLAESALVDVAGNVKFQAVMSGLEQLVAQVGQSDKLAAIERAVGPIINMVVTALTQAAAWEKQFAGLFSFLKSATTTPLSTPSTPPVVASLATSMSAGGSATPVPGA